MAVPTAKKLLESAQSGERKLSPKERRHVVAYLKGTQPEITNVEMASIFGVTEKTIRMDFLAIRKEKAKLIKEDDIGLIIADIALDYERQVMDIEKSKAKAPLGSRRFLDHCTSAMDLRLKVVKALQDLGYLPKNLGSMTVQKYDFKAVVDERTGAVDGVYNRDFLRELGEEGDEAPFIDAEIVEKPQLQESNEQISDTGDEPEVLSNAGSEIKHSGSTVGASEAAPDPVSVG